MTGDTGPGSTRLRCRRGLVAGLAAAALVAGVLRAGGAQAASASLYVVSTPNSAGSAAAASAVTSVGGTVVATLDVADGVAAQLTSSQVRQLQSLSGVVVTTDFSVSVSATTSSTTSPTTSTTTSTTSTTTRAPAAVFPQETGANRVWAGGNSGQGVNVAVVDTGIDSLRDFSGRLVDGVDLSGGGNPFLDGYGHGTFVAGLIAGNGASSRGRYMGEAPGAGLVSVKVAGPSGSTDLVTVIEGIQWVVDHRVADHIGVVNLSLGAVPHTSTVLDPLDRAVETTWHSGVVVVVAAGNAGPFNGTILTPGDDPLVITAGALDDIGTPTPSDDTMTSFSSVGPTNPDGWFKPDLVTSGRSVVSLRAPGSTIDTNFPSARIGGANFVGSGTSFSAAVTSGAAALVRAASPAATPDQVKARLLGTTRRGPVGNPFVDGHGALYVAAAVGSGFGLTQPTPSVATAVGAVVSLPANWSTSSWDPANWSGGTFTGTPWTGSAWDGYAWNGSAWDGSAWDGTAWDGQYWTGSAWDGSAWDGSAWDGTAWDGSAWAGTAWSGSAWDGSAWS